MMRWLQGRRIPRWFGAPANLFAFTAIQFLVPWAVSRTTVLHGWGKGGTPGAANLSGLTLVALGFSAFIWSMRAHYKEAPQGWVIERTPHYPTPAYLLAGGPYRYSRNPIYLAEGLIWIGWIVFYGSLSLLALFGVGALVLGPIVVPREERGLDARFGESYRKYCRATPRWFGRTGLEKQARSS